MPFLQFSKENCEFSQFIASRKFAAIFAMRCSRIYIHNTFCTFIIRYRFSYKYITRALNELSDYVYDRAVAR